MRDKFSKTYNKITADQDSGRDFEALVTYEVYRELMAIAQEIETCRASL